jgi:hypothetical protein
MVDNGIEWNELRKFVMNGDPLGGKGVSNPRYGGIESRES